MNSQLEIQTMPSQQSCLSYENASHAGVQQKFYNNSLAQRSAAGFRAGECIRKKAQNCQINIVNPQKEISTTNCMEIEDECNLKQNNNFEKQQLQDSRTTECNTFSDYFSSKRFQQIQVLMKSASNEEAYSSRIISSMINSQKSPSDFLQNHTITPEIRAKMIDWMIEVTTSYGQSDQTFFLAVQYMDNFFQKSQRQLTPQDLHLTGVASMFIACKYEEIYPLRLQTFYEKIGHKKLSISDIKQREQEILATIDFDLSSPTILDFMAVTVQKLNLEEHLLDSHLTFFRKMCIYLAKMVSHEYSIINNHNQTTIAGAIIYVSFKILQQMYNEFNLVALIQQVIQILSLNNEEILKASTLLLNLARSFERQYPNLNNLRKFSADIQQISASPSQSQQKPSNQQQNRGIN
ncbi:hypothetical protein ABPG74_021272 [Tetrahymena malaccensis]